MYVSSGRSETSEDEPVSDGPSEADQDAAARAFRASLYDHDD